MSSLADQGVALRVKCEAAIEGLLRDAAELGWELAKADATLAQARIMAADEAVQPIIVALVGQIMKAGDLVAKVADR